jgi:hypothetical protein
MFAMQGNQFIDGRRGSACDWLSCSSMSLAGQRALPGQSANAWNTIQQEVMAGHVRPCRPLLQERRQHDELRLGRQGRSGGTNYLIGYNRTDDDGMMPFHEGSMRHNFRLNVDQSMRQDLTISASALVLALRTQTSRATCSS